jgi:hypothetical protein
MKQDLLILAWVILGVLFFPSLSWAVCPQDPIDNGECDTMYVEVWPTDDTFDPPGPDFVRVPIYVTHDLPTPPIPILLSIAV